MSDAARQAAVSEVYFRKCFTETYGISPLRYVQQLRMKKAQQLLCEGRRTVEQIALECGYKSVYSFSNAFHRLTGFSPTGYARANKEI
ncbi:MAG: AraC family transcriptional regulator [Clostridiales bacterium]|nr:AraC family transcriptional regulator [Clostridiales bacterium]